VATGSSVSLSVTANGSRPFSYQWQIGGVNLSGATDETYRISNAQAADAGSYTVLVSNSLGSTKSNTATITVTSSTVVIRNSNQMVTTGHAVSFTAENAAAGGEWQLSSDGGSTWSGVTGSATYRNVNTATLDITGVSSAMSGNRYRYVTSGDTSNAATLTVSPAYFPFPTGIAADVRAIFSSATPPPTRSRRFPPVERSVRSPVPPGRPHRRRQRLRRRFNDPAGVTAASDGTLGVADSANGTIRQISSGGTVSTLAGSTSNRGNADGNGRWRRFPPRSASPGCNGDFYVTDP